MAEPTAKNNPIMEEISKALFGRSRIESIQNNRCVICGESALEFKDELSRREYSISGMCQGCQDEVFSD